MPALTAGAVAPEFTLPLVSGGEVSLQDALRRGHVVLAFFKISCPVCQFAFPFIERIYQAYRGKSVTIVGVSQNDAHETKQFMEEFGVTFPVLLDDRSRYPVSNAYGLTNVPTLFYIAPDGEIELSIVSWDRKDMENLSARLAKGSQTAPVEIFHPGESVPDFRPG